MHTLFGTARGSNPGPFDPKSESSHYSTAPPQIAEREWADPGGTAIPGQPVGKSQQAPASSHSAKNQFNIDVPRWGTYQILS